MSGSDEREQRLEQGKKAARKLKSAEAEIATIAQEVYERFGEEGLVRLASELKIDVTELIDIGNGWRRE